MDEGRFETLIIIKLMLTCSDLTPQQAGLGSIPSVPEILKIKEIRWHWHLMTAALLSWLTAPRLNCHSNPSSTGQLVLKTQAN